jgi:hypothetical protein
VTLEQFRQFEKGWGAAFPAKHVQAVDLPVNAVNWFMAAAYCNWLSKQEGVPEDQWCYATGAQGQVTKLKEKYLSLSGYRLPTEAEMEYATRAGAVTARYYGETDELLEKYAWYTKNSREKTWPVGSLKPNDLGLFDTQGNVYTWCQEAYANYPSASKDGVVDDREYYLLTTDGSRVLRGGSFIVPASDVRSASRNLNVPATRDIVVGFRPARTLTLSSPASTGHLPR